VIFIGSEESSIGQWVSQSGAGWLVGPGDVDALKAAIAEASQASECARRGLLARSYGMEYFSSNKNACRVADLIMNGSEH